MTYLKKTLQFSVIFYCILLFSQTNKVDSLRGNFTYLLKGKIYKSSPDYIHEELFSLQVSDSRAFFISEKALKFDSVFQKEFENAIHVNNKVIDFRNKSFPKTKFKYTIIQSAENIKFYESVAMTLLYYKEPIINNWKLIDEQKIVNTFNCKKAIVNYKGRNWIAWYTTEIPLSYGPYKFSGLPGLIIKISDENDDYEFELINSQPSNNLKGKIVTVNKLRYEKDAVETTREKSEELKKNFDDNMIGNLQSMGSTLTDGQKENIRNIQKQRQINKIDQNPIELID